MQDEGERLAEKQITCQLILTNDKVLQVTPFPSVATRHQPQHA